MPEFKNDRDNRLRKSWNYLRSLSGYLSQKDYRAVEKLVLFIGYPRSGHTLLGSLLDAHPEMVFAHELDVLYYYQQQFSIPQIFYLQIDSTRQFNKADRQWMGYHYTVENQWQGRYQKLKVIGDKSGGRTARRLLDPSARLLLEEIESRTQLPLLLLHNVRNPFDIITTMMNRSAKRSGAPPTRSLLERKVGHFFNHVAAVEQLKQDGRNLILDVYHEAFTRQPAEELQKIGQFLQIPMSNEYLRDCSAIVWDKARQSRHTTDLWSTELISSVQAKIAAYDFLRHYSFDE